MKKTVRFSQLKNNSDKFDEIEYIRKNLARFVSSSSDRNIHIISAMDDLNYSFDEALDKISNYPAKDVQILVYFNLNSEKSLAFFHAVILRIAELPQITGLAFLTNTEESIQAVKQFMNFLEIEHDNLAFQPSASLKTVEILRNGDIKQQEVFLDTFSNKEKAGEFQRKSDQEKARWGTGYPAQQTEPSAPPTADEIGKLEETLAETVEAVESAVGDASVAEGPSISRSPPQKDAFSQPQTQGPAIKAVPIATTFGSYLVDENIKERDIAVHMLQTLLKQQLLNEDGTETVRRFLDKTEISSTVHTQELIRKLLKLPDPVLTEIASSAISEQSIQTYANFLTSSVASKPFERHIIFSSNLAVLNQIKVMAEKAGLSGVVFTSCNPSSELSGKDISLAFASGDPGVVTLSRFAKQVNNSIKKCMESQYLAARRAFDCEVEKDLREGKAFANKFAPGRGSGSPTAFELKSMTKELNATRLPNEDAFEIDFTIFHEALAKSLAKTLTEPNIILTNHFNFSDPIPDVTAIHILDGGPVPGENPYFLANLLEKYYFARRSSQPETELTIYFHLGMQELVINNDFDLQKFYTEKRTGTKLDQGCSFPEIPKDLTCVAGNCADLQKTYGITVKPPKFTGWLTLQQEKKTFNPPVDRKDVQRYVSKMKDSVSIKNALISTVTGQSQILIQRYDLGNCATLAKTGESGSARRYFISAEKEGSGVGRFGSLEPNPDVTVTRTQASSVLSSIDFVPNYRLDLKTGKLWGSRAETRRFQEDYLTRAQYNLSVLRPLLRSIAVYLGEREPPVLNTAVNERLALGKYPMVPKVIRKPAVLASTPDADSDLPPLTRYSFPALGTFLSSPHYKIQIKAISNMILDKDRQFYLGRVQNFVELGNKYHEWVQFKKRGSNIVDLTTVRLSKSDLSRILSSPQSLMQHLRFFSDLSYPNKFYRNNCLFEAILIFWQITQFPEVKLPLADPVVFRHLLREVWNLKDPRIVKMMGKKSAEKFPEFGEQMDEFYIELLAKIMRIKIFYFDEQIFPDREERPLPRQFNSEETHPHFVIYLEHLEGHFIPCAFNPFVFGE